MGRFPVFRDSLRLIRSGLGTFVFFEMIYRTFFALVALPICRMLAGQAMRISVGDYLTNANFGQFVGNPFVLLILMAIVLIFALCTVVEIAGLLLCFDAARRGERIGAISLFAAALGGAARLLRPKNLWLLGFVILVLPLTSLGATCSLLESVTLPNYIGNVIQENRFLLGVMTVTTIVASYIALTFLLTFHGFFVDGRSAWDSAAISRQRMRGYRLRIFFTIILLNILLGAISVPLSDLLLSIAGATSIFNENLVAISIFLGCIAVAHSLLSFLFAMLAVMVVYAPLTAHYHNTNKTPPGNKKHHIAPVRHRYRGVAPRW